MGMTTRKQQQQQDPIYKVIFQCQGQVYEMYAKGVASAPIFGFVEVESFLFGERSKIIVDSSEERLKTEFAGVKRAYIPLHAVIRIDQVEREGASRITSSEKGESGGVSLFPVPVPPAGKTDR
jgi:hypothetical protein